MDDRSGEFKSSENSPVLPGLEEGPWVGSGPSAEERRYQSEESTLTSSDTKLHC